MSGNKPNPFGIKLNSNTVVMKKDYVSTGQLTYVEGDIIEVEMSDLKSFNLGDKVKITIYSTGGIHVFESHVVAKANGSLIILNPPENNNKFAERREHPRIEVAEEGLLQAITEAKSQERRELEEPVNLTINNISISGIGFSMFGHFELANATQLEMEMKLSSTVPIQAEIVRREKKEYGYYYGAQFTNMSADQMNSLRAYVLKQQVETYYRTKEENKKREALNQAKAQAKAARA
ncbi:flagellar brake protein [Paenibacillus chartarius]|uniref:Flagellar brake protein n=1 Tax=Paenibacillus chartarius TaxID=747481 RepID=A0ABV6DUV7_9BACL